MSLRCPIRAVQLPMMVSCILLACRSGPRDAIAWEERWEMLVLTEHGNLLDTRLIVSNRELVRGQGRVHLDHWGESSVPITHTRQLHPDDVEIDLQGRGLRLGLDRLDLDDFWTLDVGSTEVNLMLEMTPYIEASALVSLRDDGGQWGMEALVPGGDVFGWLEAGGRGGQFRGRGVLLHRGGDVRAELPRESVFLFDGDTAIGVEIQQGRQLAWARLNGEDLSTADLRFERRADGATLDFRPAVDLVIEVRAKDPVGTTDPLRHYSWLERMTAELFTDVAWRRVEAGVATLVRGESSQVLGAILLSEGPNLEPIGATPGSAE